MKIIFPSVPRCTIHTKSFKEFINNLERLSGRLVTNVCGLFQMVMCIPLICISNECELVQTYQREKVQQMTHAIFCKLLYGGFILGESESVQLCFPNSFLIT